MPRHSFHVVTFVEGDFEDIRAFEDFTSAAAYSRGFVSGAGRYGAGSVRAFVLPNEADELEAFAPGSLGLALEAIEKEVTA